MSTVDHCEFLEKLEACERISAVLLLALEGGQDGALKILDRRKALIEELTTLLPANLDHAELRRLEALLDVGAQARHRAIQMRLEAAHNLAALQQSLNLARQLAPPRAPREHILQVKG
jgi:hypothetical protein